MLYYGQGSAIVTEDELFEKPTFAKVTNFYLDLMADRKPSPITLSTGKLQVDTVIRAFDPGAGGAPVPFQPIGPGLPLTIMIREVYTGKYPSACFLSLRKTSDLLVTSAIKSITTYDAKPRALNFLMNAVSPGTHLKRPSAVKQGTPVVFYSPALIEKSLTLDLSQVFDRFPQEVFNTIGETFQSAAGIPIFLSHSVYLLAAGAIAKIVGTAGEALFDGKPTFTASEPLNIHWPGEAPLPRGFALITDVNLDRIDAGFRSKYKINAAGQVVDDAGKAYNGDIPYVVISLDGTRQEELTPFTPTAASAAILSQFFGMKDGQPQAIRSLLDALKLYSDFSFRQEIDRLDKEIAGLPDGEHKDNLKKKREAVAKNILTDLLKKP